MTKYFIEVKRNGHLFPNIIATLHKLGTKFRNLENKIVPLYPLYPRDYPRVMIGSTVVPLTDIRIVEGKSASAIASYYQQIEIIKQKIEEVIKGAKKRKATVEDFQMQMEEEE